MKSMTTMFRIYCADVDSKKMTEVLRKHLQNFTIIPATGFYKGIRERAAVIEVFETDKETVNKVSQELAKVLRQELVVYVELPITVTGVTAGA